MLQCVLIAGIGFIQIETGYKSGVFLLEPDYHGGITFPLDGVSIATKDGIEEGTKLFTFTGPNTKAVVQVYTYNHMMGSLNEADYSDWHFRGVDKILEGCK